MTLRTASLVQTIVTTSNSDVDLYTVPTGKRTIVRSIQVHNNNTVACQVWLSVKRSGTYRYWHLTNVGNQGNIDLQPYQVLNDGDKLACYCTPTSGTTSITIIASGPELAV